MFLFIALLVTLVIAIYFWQKSAFSYWKDRGIPQPEPKFPFGTITIRQHFVYTIQEYYDRFRGKTKYLGLYNSLQPNLLVLDEDITKLVMVKDFNHFASHGTFVNEKDDPLSAHLFSLDGAKWRALRTKLTPTFTSGKMRAMCPIVIDIGQRFKETMDKLIENGDKGIDMREMFAKFTTDVIGTCAFGLECNSLNDPNAEFRRMGMKVFNEPKYPMYLMFVFMAFPNLAKKLRIKVTSDEVEKFFLKVVNDTFEHRIRNNIKRDDFVDLLIKLRNKTDDGDGGEMEGLTMLEIAAQCFVFFLAGFETSSTASSFTIYELSKNQRVQDKLREHIREVLKKHDGKMTYDALKDMTYLEQCIKEGLRMYPPVPILNRVVTEEYKLPETNVVLPKGLLTTIPIYAFQHDPKNFPNPKQFDPDRFTPEESAKRHPFSYLPFGEGPRNCIGERFGMMQAKIGMAYLIGNYRFKLNSKTQPMAFKKNAFVLTPVGNLYFDVDKM